MSTLGGVGMKNKQNSVTSSQNSLTMSKKSVRMSKSRTREVKELALPLEKKAKVLGAIKSTDIVHN